MVARKKAVRKKAVRKTAVKKVVRKPRVKAPIYFIAYVIHENKKYYVAGNTFDSDLRKAVLFQDQKRARLISDKLRQTLKLPSVSPTQVILFEKSRAKNPVPLATNTKIAKAVDLFRSFTGHDPEFVDTVNFNIPDVGMLIGKCDGVLYTTVRDGKTEKYIHEFTGRTRPLLAVSFDGKQLLMLGGAYTFTERGIVG